MRLSEREQEIVRDSFAAVLRGPTAAGAAFYDHLFTIAPQTRDLFVADIDRQAVKLVDTLRIVVDEIGNWGLLRTILEDLAVRHTAYGVQPAHYPPTGEALIAMLRIRMGAAFTPEVSDTWRKVYDAVQDAMIAAAYPLHRPA